MCAGVEEGWRDGGSGEHEDEGKDWRVVGF